MNLEEYESAVEVERTKISRAQHELEVLKYRYLKKLTGHNFYKAKHLSFSYKNGVKAVGLMCYFGFHQKDVAQHGYKRGGFYFAINEGFPSLYQAFGSTLINNPIDYSTVKPIAKDSYDSFIKEMKRTGAQFKAFKKTKP